MSMREAVLEGITRIISFHRSSHPDCQGIIAEFQRCEHLMGIAGRDTVLGATN